MSPRAAAAAVARGAASTVHAPTRTRTPSRSAPARRRSGAAAAPRSGARTLPRADFVGLLDRLLRGPAYIAVVGILLAGIVFFNVDVLELNHGIASTDKRSGLLKRENAALTLQVAKLGSSERIQRMALGQGLVLPQPGDVRYLRANSLDAARALRVMTSPDSSGAAAVVPAVVTQQSTPTSATVTPQPTTPVPTTTPVVQATTPVAQTTTPAQTTPAPQAQTTPPPAPAATNAAPATQAGATAAPTTTTP
jgi:cell division protein FtsL